MEVLFATSNADKVGNARAALAPFGISVVQAAIELIESRAEDPADIALEKARQAYDALKRPVMVEDSGFFIAALGGFPMTHVKFSLKTLGVERILKAMDGEADRSAEWRMTVAYVEGPAAFKTFTFVEPGAIAASPRPIKRAMMSDYWRIYMPRTLDRGNDRALCEMADEELAAWLDYYAKNNQFKMLGEWLAARNAR